MNISRKYTARHKSARRQPIKGIVLHDTFGSGTHNDTKYLANPGDGRQVSCDFTVEKDGAIYQLNPDLKKYATFHAGRATAFKGLRNGNVTHATIGIEIVQNQKKAEYPAAQIKAVADLCKYLCQQHGLKAADITTHQKIITDGSRTDPRNFPFDEFWKIFNGDGGNTGGGNTPNATEKKTL